jgi:hypothetical protein
MSDLNNAGSAPPAPAPQAMPASPIWVLVVGATFGAITLIGLFVFAAIAGMGHTKFICNSFLLLAAICAFGAALSASFIGGSAAANGQLGNQLQRFSLVFSAGGGVAFFLIVFAMFWLFKPDNCGDAPKPQQVTIDFRNIPSALAAAVDDPEIFWTKVKIDGKSPNSPYHFSLLVQPTNMYGSLAISDTGKNLDLCRVQIKFLDDGEDIGDKLYGVGFQRYRINSYGNRLKFDYVKATSSDTSRNVVKASNPICFNFNGEPIANTIIVAQSRNTFINGVPAELQLAPIEEGGTTSSVPPIKTKNSTLPSLHRWVWRLVAPIQRAHAGNDLTFESLVNELKSPEAVQRMRARQFLGENFSEYEEPALKELFKADQEPTYLVSLLSAVIIGIDRVSDGQFVPGKKRDLSKRLPYISGFEPRIIKLTGHPDEGVKKQARRLVQRFPYDAFDMAYKPYLRGATKCDLSQASDENDSVQYGFIFFTYNRMIQYAINEGTTVNSVARIEKIADVARKAAVCLDDDLRVDAALLDYGLTNIYSQNSNYKSKVVESASKFLATTKSSNASYYFPAHITQVRTLADKASGSFEVPKGTVLTIDSGK